jgi:hypothetical protein
LFLRKRRIAALIVSGVGVVVVLFLIWFTLS